MQPNQPQTMSQEQALIQIKLRQKNLLEIKKLKDNDLSSTIGLIVSITTSHSELAQVIPSNVIDAYAETLQCRRDFLKHELALINRELEQAEQLIHQAESPILVPRRGGPMGGGSITQL